MKPGGGNGSPEGVDQVLAVLLNENDHLARFDSFAGVGQCKTIRATNQVTIIERLVRLSRMLHDDARLVRNFLIGALKKDRESGHDWMIDDRPQTTDKQLMVNRPWSVVKFTCAKKLKLQAG